MACAFEATSITLTSRRPATYPQATVHGSQGRSRNPALHSGPRRQGRVWPDRQRLLPRRAEGTVHAPLQANLEAAHGDALRVQPRCHCAASVRPEGRTAQRFREDRLADGVSARTVNMDVATLVAMLHWGADKGIIGSNPLKKVKPMMHTPKDGRPLTDDEVKRLLDRSPQSTGPTGKSSSARRSPRTIRRAECQSTPSCRPTTRPSASRARARRRPSPSALSPGSRRSMFSSARRTHR